MNKIKSWNFCLVNESEEIVVEIKLNEKCARISGVALALQRLSEEAAKKGVSDSLSLLRVEEGYFTEGVEVENISVK